MKERADQSTIQRDGDTPGAYIGDTLLMMSVEQGRYFSLNGVASRIWELLEEPTTPAKLVTDLVSEYEITPEDCAQQVATFLTALRDYHLLVEHLPPCA